MNPAQDPSISSPPARALSRTQAAQARLARTLAEPAGAVVLTTIFRVLYLARFGADQCGMNENFLLEARAMHFGYPAEVTGQPLVPALLFMLRAAGAGAPAALGILY